MKKRNMIAALLCSACHVAGSVNPVFADASKVVTLGADLTDAQKQELIPQHPSAVTEPSQDDLTRTVRAAALDV